MIVCFCIFNRSVRDVVPLNVAAFDVPSHVALSMRNGGFRISKKE